ncbi:MAG TPA: efflux RND transporter permease subunit [Candidatus Acidoferrales bacterium]|jgi:multidrug efflux pump subunit AcrB|nr:efflux RND transporter permease subunit [Candidatus Acidoferrales bacterium]
MSDKKSSHSASASPESRYWFARHSKSIIFLILTLAVVGVYEALSLPIAVFPATNFPRIIVGVDNGVMPIEQMEVTITRPLENAVNSVPGLEDVRSTTSRGSAEIDLSFNWSVDMVTTLQLVNSEIARIQSTLPSTAAIETHRLDFASFPIIGYSLTSDKVPQTQLWEIATYDMKPRLNRLNGVATVIVQGGQQPEFQVTPDTSKMLRAHVTVQDILDAANHTNIVDSPGLLSRNHQLFLGLVDSQVHNADDIGNMVIKNVGDAPVRVRDIGSVAASVAPNYTVVTANGKPAVLLSISRQPESNTVEVANLVHQEIEGIRSKLPAGVDLNVFYDQSNIVRESIGSVRDAIIIGLLLAGFIIWLFLRDVGTALMTGLVIPVAIFVTFIAMKILGQSFNMMTLGGLAAAGGLVIDDAIVVVENIVLHRDGGEGRLEAVNSALKELTVPLIGSTLTPIVVFLPLISITGVTGTFFRALAIAMSVSLLTSLALALTWSTNLGVYLIRRGHGEESGGSATTEHAPPEDSENGEFERMKRMMAAEEESLKGGLFEKIIVFYERWMRRALEHPIWLGGFCVILIAVSYLCYSQLGTDLLPHMDEGGFILDYVMPPGSSLQETNRVVTHVENIIKSFPEVENTSRRTGLQLGLAAVTEPNTGDIAVKLKDGSRRPIDDIISDVRAKVTTEEPALDVEFTQVLQDMISDLTGAPQPIVVQLFSPDVDQLTAWAPRVADALGRIQINYKKPVVDVEDGIDNTTSGPAVVFTVNPAAAAKAGFTTDQLTTVASAIVDGEPATAPMIIDDKPYTLRVRYPAANRASLEAMNNTVIVNSNGGAATLGSISTFTEVPGQTEILRDNLQQEKEVTGRLEGIDLGRGIAAVQKAVNDLHLPPSIRVAYGGTFKEQQKSFHDLVVVLLLALVLIFLVLLFEFRSFSAPIAILSSAVLSTSGVFFALFVTKTDFNVASFMGLIMVLGIVAKNGILLLDANQKFRAFGFGAEEAMIQAGRRRLRPIVMTAMAAVAGMLPLSLAIGAGSQMLQPLAIAVIGGILISMVLSLIITPAIQFYLTRDKEAAVTDATPVEVR